MYEFRYGNFLKAFIYIFGPGLIALFVWVLLQYNDQNAVVYFVVMLPASLAMIALAVYAIADVVVGRFVIDEDSVTIRSPLGTRRLLLGEIAGFRLDQNYIRIIPQRTGLKEIRISNYFKGAQQIIRWLEELYPNLDIAAGNEEEQQVLQNEEFGLMEEDRLRRLGRARKVARVLNGGAWVILIWLIAFPKYLATGMIVAAVYPIIAIFAGLHYRGLISPDEYENSTMPSMGLAFILPGIMLALRVVMDYNILLYPATLWIGVAALSIVLGILYMVPSFRLRTKPLRFYGTGFIMIFLSLFYSYGVVIMTNCMFDQSTPAKYETTVANKRYSTGKSTTYYVDLHPWGALTGTQEARISKAQYDKVEIGDPAVVTQHGGYLKIPWIEVDL